MRFNFPENVIYSCSKCGLCCGDTTQKRRHVLLLKSDADRISALTKQPVDSFASERLERAPYLYEMHKDPEGKCVFLEDTRCTIYDARPLICRFYPVELSTDENRVYCFRVTEECPGVCRGTKGVGRKLNANYFKALFDLARAELNCKSF